MENKIKKHLLYALSCPPLSNAIGPQNLDFKCLVYNIIGYIQQIVVVIFAMSVLIIIWGIFKYIFLAQGDEKQIDESKNVMFWGIVGLFVMVSVWGLVKVLVGTFGF
ncbi:MAG: hypothetical protein AAB840_00305 [Patescibacteria group bacterium]